MRNIAVADCETDPFRAGRIPKPFLWGYFDGVQYRQFEDTRKFALFLKKQGVICYAHNGGKFDWHFLLEYLNPYDEVMLINGRIARCWIGNAECRDSYNILPVPLAAYKKDVIDYRLMEKSERKKSANWEKICSYLKNDCLYLHELVSRFIAEYGLQITLASAGMAQWKKISGLKAPQTDREYYKRYSPFYYGGRVECFQSGIIEKPFSVFDINSAYPYAMMNEHPYSDEVVKVRGYVKDADFLNVECVSRGAFPFRGLGEPGEAAGLRFPNDDVRRVYSVTGWEFDAAMDTCTIDKVQVIESFRYMDRVSFSPYVKHFYEMRLKAIQKRNDAESLFAKLLMNSLYGKFASNPDNYRQYYIVPMDVVAGLDAHGWMFEGEFGPWGLASAELEAEARRYYNVATSASITGFVRAMLWRAIAGSKGILYCDTDSVAVEIPGKEIKLGSALGEWKHEGEFDKAGIAGKKLYIFRGVEKKGKRVFKFASKGARLTKAQLWKVASGKPVDFVSTVPTFSIRKSPEFVNREIKFTARKERV